MEKDINNIFERQTENEMKDLLLTFCRENGHDTNKIDGAMEKVKDLVIMDHWDCPRYNRESIGIMLNEII
jgi:hypothetical protein